MRLIDADKLLNDYQELADCDFVHPLYEDTLRDIVDDAPTVEIAEDCITKVEVINTIHKIIYGFFDIADDDSEEPINDKDKLLLTINKAISNAVKVLPSVTPSRPRGKWIQTKDECEGVNFYNFSFECSKCGKERSFKSNYCPNCGAKMGESEGGEE